MKNVLRSGCAICISLLLITCSSNHKGEYAAEQALYDIESESKSTSSSTEYAEEMVNAASEEMRASVSSSAATIGKHDSIRKFIRTAEIRFRTKNTVKAVYAIEDIAVKHGGFIAYSHMASERGYTDEIPITKDSTLIITHFTVTNQMTLRVPNAQLDTTLKDIAKWIDYLDYRTVRADDISINLQANKLAQKREGRSAQRVENAIDNRGRKLNETIEGEETLSNKQQNADNAYLSNLSLMDRVNYSTVTLSIYQRETNMKELVANEKNIDAYKPGFGHRLYEALVWGGNALLDVLLFFVNIWPFVLLICAGLIIYKIRKKRKNKE